MKLINCLQAFEQRLLEEMNESCTGIWKRKMNKKRRVRNEDYDDYDDAESERIEAEDINRRIFKQR
jgi:RNA polymerase sigma-54 factor